MFEPETPHVIAIARLEVAQESDGDVLEPRVGDGLQELARVTLPGDGAGMGDAEALVALVREAPKSSK